MKKTTEEMINELEKKKQELMKQLEDEKSDNMEYVIARTYSAGVFAGYLYMENGKECVLKNARRIWYWEGAASLSQLAVDGTSKPNECKFPVEVPELKLKEVIEILKVTPKAKKSINDVPVWSE